MTIKGHIIDSTTRAGIPQASVTIVNTNGKYLGQGVTTDGNGDFGFDSSIVDNNMVLITSVGYTSSLIDPNLLTDDPAAIVPLDENFQGLDAAVITAKIPNKAGFAWLFVAVAGGSLYCLSRPVPTGRNTVNGAVGAVDASKFIIPLAVVGLGAAVLVPILQKYGLLSTAQDKAKATAQAAAGSDQSAKGKTVTGTRGFSDSDLDSFATQITDATNHTLFYDYDNLTIALAYFSGFHSADAIKFLGDFVDKNAQTFYQWYLDKFVNSDTYGDLSWQIHSQSVGDLAPNFLTMGLDTSGSVQPDDLVNAAVNYVYKVAGESKQ